MTSPPTPPRVGLYGLGSIGGAVARSLLAADGARIAVAIDTDPAKVGRDLRSVLKLKGDSGILVRDDAAAALRETAPDVVIHSTGSRLSEVAPQLETILGAGVPCVTSCEEMAFPAATDAGIAQRLDRLAREKNVAILGAGVNPGFAMDALVLALSAATRCVSHVRVERVLDPMSRRAVFRRKVGIGLTYEQASRLVEQGRMGHVGLKQSAMLIAHGLGWDVSGCSEELRILCEGDDPARRPRRPARAAARVVGLQQSLIVRNGRKERIRMEMLMAAGVEAAHDAITITGEPDLNLWIQGGIPGDEATVACLLNAAIQVLSPPRPGLLTVLDLPLRPPTRGAVPDRLHS